MPLLPENVVALGRIGGPLLDSNLKRKNAGTGEENLAFGNTSLVNPTVLYLDVINGRVGINTDTPTHPLNVSNIRTTNLIVPTQTEIENFVITTNTIQNISTAITISPDQTTDPVIDMVKIGTYDYGSSVAYLNISDQLIENINNNSNIEISPNGLGAVNITTSKLYVDGNFTATGNINWDGSLITLGSNDSDNVVFNADVNSNIVPNINETYDLGTALKRWNTIYTEDFPVDNLNLDSAIINGIDMLLEQGNTIYVSIYGDDLNVGTHLHNTYRTVKYALSQATAGDTVVIFPGTYEEIFPLTVPAGVTVNGAGIRAVTITGSIKNVQLRGKSERKVLTGGEVLSKDKGHKLDKIAPAQYGEFLGRARMVTISKDQTTIIDGKGEESAIELRAAEIKDQIEKATSFYEKEKLQERLGKLIGGVAIISVGGNSDIEIKEKADRVEDALFATKAALAEGIVPGGGIVLYDVLDCSEDNNDKGLQIVSMACAAPFMKILENAGNDKWYAVAHEIHTSKLKNATYDAKNGKTNSSHLLPILIVSVKKILSPHSQN